MTPQSLEQDLTPTPHHYLSLGAGPVGSGRAAYSAAGAALHTAAAQRPDQEQSARSGTLEQCRPLSP